MKGFLLVVSGAAGTGKGTIIKKAMPKNDRLILSVSATTRSPRAGEVEGESYFFISKDEFNKMVDMGEFLEHAYVHTDFYGTPRRKVEEEILNGKIVVLEIDVQGAKEVVRKYENVVSIFIIPPSFDELEKRLRDRNSENEAEIERRMSNARIEIGQLDSYDYVILNDDVERCTEDFLSIVRAEMLRTDREYYDKTR
ncbi:MAG: guanylate kinase [Tissierellia bacterium]|nr:guanylate kinase [Tissierellia bacterium]